MSPLYAPTLNASSRGPPTVQLIIMEDDQAVITIIKKGQTLALRHLHRTHRINLDWITETCQQEMDLRYVGTKEQVADMMTKHFEPKKADLWGGITSAFAHLSGDPLQDGRRPDDGRLLWVCCDPEDRHGDCQDRPRR